MNRTWVNYGGFRLSLAEALAVADIVISKFDPIKARPVSTNQGTVSLEKFSKMLREALGKKAIKYPDVFEALHDQKALVKLIKDFAEEEEILVDKNAPKEMPKELDGMTLNMDLASGRDTEFFVTSSDEVQSVITGASYIKLAGLKDPEAVAVARKVVRSYEPRRKPGVTPKKFDDGLILDVYNTYQVPPWKKADVKIPLRPPALFEKLVKHLFPLPIEQEYFYSWLYYSLYDRAFVYLVLCGPPGTGKNRLKLVLRALHGHLNTIDGKRSTLVERFNSQLSECTLAWFDELKYNEDMENVMKELQNDSISIERKGVDATRATSIHASLVISNNKPRDNFLAMDARKFAPLLLNPNRLEKSMTPDEINELTGKVERPDSKTYDIDFLARIALWIKKNGKSKKWPHLEYRGPMFYKLAHTSMSRAQKKAASMVLELNPKQSNKLVYDEKKGFLWSSVEEFSMRKNGDRSLKFPPDYSTTKHFFDVFLDGTGRKAFKTIDVPGSLMGDFWVKKILDEVKIITESDKVEVKEVKNSAKETEFIDL